MADFDFDPAMFGLKADHGALSSVPSGHKPAAKVSEGKAIVHEEGAALGNSFDNLQQRGGRGRGQPSRGRGQSRGRGGSHRGNAGRNREGDSHLVSGTGQAHPSKVDHLVKTRPDD